MPWETVQIVIVLALVAAVFFGFVRERLPPEMVAMIALGMLLATGILSASEALTVFSNSGPITVGCMFVLTAALERTGLIEAAGTAVSRAAGRSPVRALVAMMLCVMVLSAFINNTPVVAILTPVAIMLARSLKVAPSRLLIPLSFASIFGGMTTLIGTSTNLLVDGVAVSHGLVPFGMFEITAAGIVLGLVGIAYMLLVGRWLLPDRQTLREILGDRQQRHFLAEMLVSSDSPLIGKSLTKTELPVWKGAKVIDLVRGDNSLRHALDRAVLKAGDRLVVRTNMADVMELREAQGLVPGPSEAHAVQPVSGQAVVIMEGIVGPQSRLAGYRIADLNFRRLYGTYILAVHRQGENLHSNFDGVRLAFGDTLLLEGPPEGLRRLFDRRVLVNLTEPSERPFRRNKAPIAIGAVLLVMVLAALEVLPIAALAIIAATAVIVLGCLTADEAYGAIQWRILFLIFGMLGLGMAMEKTGAGALIVNHIVGIVGGLGPLAILAAIYLLTSLLTEIVSNNAAAILLTPIAIGLAQQLGMDPRPFVVAVLFAASASFATPIGYQTNTLVYSAGGYRFTDFVRIGLPLNIVMWISATVVIPIFWPFR
jgi:di/tricarboxylate transporter